MTENKPIIIDGVDISKCKYYDDLDCYAERDSCGYPLDCKDSPNCYFKQLARKTQECEELKREIAFGNNGTLSDKIRAEVFKELNNENNQLKATKEQAEQKLERIRDIAYAITNGTHFTDDTVGHLKELVKMIMQIIDEVENE